MRTRIIISKDWKLIKEYDFLMTLTKDDSVEFDGVEYKVNCCFLEIESNTMLILLNS